MATTVSVPTTNSVSDAGTTGLKAGGVGGLGAVLGRSMLGPGLGTAAGGVLAAAAMGGNARDTVATVAVMQGADELFSGAQQTNSGGRRRL